MNLVDLANLNDNWNGYGEQRPTEEALHTASVFSACPLSNGGIQVELHAGGCDIEIEILPDGRVLEVWAEPVEGWPER